MKCSARLVSIAILGAGLAAGIPGVAAADLDETLFVESGGTLYVDLERGSVEVASHDSETVEIHATVRRWALDSCFEFDVSQKGADVHLEGEVEGPLSWLFCWSRVRVQALVPRDYSVSVVTHGGSIAVEEIGGRVGAQSSGGSIKLRGIDGPAEVRTSGGSIRVADVLGDVQARTSGGRISVERVDGDVDVRTSGGSIRIEGARGRANAKTSGGRISASFDGPPAGVLETSGGGITVRFPFDSAVNLDAMTSGGHVRIDHPITLQGSMSNRHVVGALNGGGELLRLRTSGGSIEVRGN